MTVDKTRTRELGSLAAAMRFASSPTGLVITLRERASLTVPEGRIEVVPAWQWALTDALGTSAA